MATNAEIAATIQYIVEQVYSLTFPDNYGFNYYDDIDTETRYNNNMVWTNPLQTIPYATVLSYVAAYLAWYDYNFNALPIPTVKDKFTSLEGRATALEATVGGFSNVRTTSALTLNTSGAGATGTQIHATKDSTVRVTYSTATTVTLGGSPTSLVVLKTCPTNSATEGDWTEVGRTASNQPTTLTISVGQQISNSGQIIADVPAGYYVKAVASGTGTHAEAFVAGQKTIYG